MSDDNDSQMIFGDLGGLKLPDICLTSEEKPRKHLTQELVPTGDRTRARCVAAAHATDCPTAVDLFLVFRLSMLTEDDQNKMAEYSNFDRSNASYGGICLIRQI